MVIRNNTREVWDTLGKVFELDPNTSALQVLDYGTRFELKWGDVIIVKPTRSNFHDLVNSAYSGPEDLTTVKENWDVYVCLPPSPLLKPKTLHPALLAPGVLRGIRERVQAFVAVWEAKWDPVKDRIEYVKKPQDVRNYMGMDFEILKRHTDRVKLMQRSGEGNSNDWVALGLSSGCWDLKRALDAIDEDAGSSKRTKI